MTEKEKALIKKFLNDCSLVLYDHSSNELEFPDDWTNDERIEFARGFHEWSGNTVKFDETDIYLPDHEVAKFLSSRID